MFLCYLAAHIFYLFEALRDESDLNSNGDEVLNNDFS